MCNDDGVMRPCQVFLRNGVGVLEDVILENGPDMREVGCAMSSSVLSVSS